MTLGAYGTLTLEIARKKARGRLSEVDEGADPVEKRRQERMRADGEDTFANLAEVYLVRHARPNKKASSVKLDEQAIARDLLPHWGNRKAAEIRRRDVIELLDSIKDRGSPVAANRVQALISTIFNVGISRDLVDFNPCNQVPKAIKEKSRDRVLTDQELRSLWEVFGKMDPIMGGLFKLRTLTLQRGTEIASMRWDDVDGDWWTIPGDITKNGKSHRVPLSSQAKAVLHQLSNYRHASGWVFPSPTRPNQHVIRIAGAIGKIREDSGVNDFRPHDLRRTGASRLTEMGFPRLVVSKLLNHSEAGITHVYDRHSYDPEKRRAVEAWGEYVERIASGQDKPSNVVELTGRQ
jgi:integrase